MASVCVIAIDRWGRFLVGAPNGGPARLPRAATRPGESPDVAALRVFEEETGEVLETLRLFGAFGAGALPGEEDALHVYYHDPDLEAELLGEEGLRFEYVAPGEVAGAGLGESDCVVLTAFVASTAYKAMFH